MFREKFKKKLQWNSNDAVIMLLLSNIIKCLLLGVAIAALRKIRGYSQEKLAEKAGISRSLVSAIEAPGIANGFSLEVLFNIADALDIDPADLINASVEFPDSVRGATTWCPKKGYEYTIILNNFLSEHRLHRTLKHEIEHIAYRDFESTVDIGIIEAIRHSAIGNNIKKEYRSIDRMKEGA